MIASQRLDELLSEYERRSSSAAPATPEELCRSCPELLPELKRQIAALRRVPSTMPHHSSHEVAGLLPASVTFSSDCDVLRSYARGGLGEVLLARDRILGREVAVKRIRPPLDGDADRRGRFLREAEVTGRLEHPGIVPVYGLGQDDAGRPCYAMRLVRGETLRDAIRSYHQGTSGAVAFRDLLGRFVGVCQAAAYAHEQGVIHRDIKPQNVVIGRFGEAVLLDWGLAKSVGSGQWTVDSEGEQDRLAATRSGAPAETAAGAVMGTPGYMAPEQAAGEVVGPSADIFSLGATLFTLLTDRAPTESLPPLGKPPAALLDIASKAMSPNPAARYPTALALAADVNHWLADEPVSAHRDPLTDRLARWGRRNRTLVRTATAALVVCVVVLAVAAFMLKRSGDRERGAAELAENRKIEAEANYLKARKAVDELFVSVSEGKLKSLPGAQPYRKELLRTALRYYQEFLADRGDDSENRADIAATYTKVAMIVGEVETAAAAVEWHEKAVAAWRDLVRDFPDRTDYRRSLAGALDMLALHMIRLGRLDAALAASDEAVRLLETMHASDPDDGESTAYLGRALVNLAVVQGKIGRNEEALRTGQRGLALDEQMILSRPNDLRLQRRLGARCINIALDLNDLGRFPEAIVVLERGLQLYDRLCAELDAHPERIAELGDAIENPHGARALAQFNLGFVLLNDEQYEASRRHLLASASGAREVAAANPSVRLFREVQLAAECDAVVAGLELGTPAVELLPEAERACETGTKLVSDDGSNPDYRGRLGQAHAARGAVLARCGRPVAAYAAWAAATDCFPREVGSSATLRALRNTSTYLRALGRLDLGDASGAAREIQATLDAADPPPFPNNRVAAARIFARCAGLSAGADRTAYEDRALEQLRLALRGGYRKADHFAADPAFAPLRGRAEFAQLQSGR